MRFEAKVKFMAVNPKTGKDFKDEKFFVFNAVNFTDAEVKVTEQMMADEHGSFFLESIVRSKIDEVFPAEEANPWFKVKVAFQGTEKKWFNNYLVSADSTTSAGVEAKKVLGEVDVDFKIEAIQLTKVTDVLFDE